MRKTYYLYPVFKAGTIQAHITSRLYPNKPSYCTEAANRTQAAHNFACAGLLQASFCLNIFGPTSYHLTPQALEHFKLLPLKKYIITYKATDNTGRTFNAGLFKTIQAQTANEARRLLNNKMQELIDSQPQDLVLAIMPDKMLVMENEYPFRKRFEITDIEITEA